MTNLHLFPGGGTGSRPSAGLTIVAIVANFGFGILANFGVGNYAPTLVMLSLMGMDPRLCFPIMAGGAALMGAGASVRHIQIGEVDLRVVLGLAIGGIPAVLVAAFIVKEMPLELLRWLVFVVVLYAAAVMAHAAWKGRREHKAESRDCAAVDSDDRIVERAQSRVSEIRPGTQGAHLSPGRARERRVRRGLSRSRRSISGRSCAATPATRRASPEAFAGGPAGDRLCRARPAMASIRRSMTRCTTRRSTCSPRPRSPEKMRFRAERHGSVSQGYFPIEETSDIHPDLVEGWVWCRRAFDIPQRARRAVPGGGLLAARDI